MRFLGSLIGAILIAGSAFAQSAPSPTYKNLTVQGDILSNRVRSTVNRTGNSYDGVFAIDDTVNGAMNGSVRPDSFFIANHYDATQTVSGYNSASWPIYIFQGYGQGGSPDVSGSTAMLGGSINIYNNSNGPAGRSEFTPLAYATVPIKGGSFASGSNFYTDINIQSTPSTGQEGYLSGMNIAVQKRSAGNVIDATHNGSNGISVYTTPTNIGFDGQNHTGDRTYPLNALAVLGGYSGVTNTDISGSQASATAAALVGLKIGGNASSVWQGPSEYSYIPTGIDIADYTTAAINIHDPNTGHAKSGTAINIANGAGNLVVGDNIFAGANNSTGLIQGTKFFANAPVTNSQAYIDFGELGTGKWRLGKQTDNSFLLYDSVNNKAPIVISTSSNMTLGSGPGTTTALNNVTTGTNAYFLCMSSSGVILLQASACTISSKRFKDIVSSEPSTDALSKVLKMKPTVFRMKPNAAASARDINYARPQLGLIAEDVAAIDKHAAIYEQDGKTPKSYRQESIIALLVGSVKKLKADNDNLEARVARLEKLLEK